MTNDRAEGKRFNASAPVAGVDTMSKLGIGLLGLVLLVSAIWVGYYAQATASNAKLWPIVMLDTAAFLLSLTAFFKIGLRRGQPSDEPTAPASAEPPLPQEKVG